jgi:hypothetical protein
MIRVSEQRDLGLNLMAAWEANFAVHLIRLSATFTPARRRIYFERIVVAGIQTSIKTEGD